MNEPKSMYVVIAFDALLSDDKIGEQELGLVGEFLPTLLKEMIWQTFDQET